MYYINNDEIKNEIKKILIDENLSMTNVAEKLGISRQQLNNTFDKVNFSFSDLNKICNAIGYKFEINIIKKDLNDFNKGKSSTSKIG